MGPSGKHERPVEKLLEQLKPLASVPFGDLVANRNDPRYGKGGHVIRQLPPLDLLHELLEERLQRPSYQPPALPAVVLELNALTRNPNVEYSQLLKVLERDPLVAGNVLRIAQSAQYSAGRPPVGLAEALARLGLSKLTEVFWRVAMHMRVFRAPGYEGALSELERHSTLVAYLARALCHRMGGNGADAFVAGLLHDAGAAACIVVLGETPGARPLFERAWPAIERTQSLAGSILGQAWSLPLDVRRVVAHQLAGQPSTLEDVITVANCAASRVRPTLEHSACGVSALDAARRRGLSSQDLQALIAEGQRYAEQLGS